MPRCHALEHTTGQAKSARHPQPAHDTFVARRSGVRLRKSVVFSDAIRSRTTAPRVQVAAGSSRLSTGKPRRCMGGATRGVPRVPSRPIHPPPLFGFGCTGSSPCEEPASTECPSDASRVANVHTRPHLVLLPQCSAERPSNTSGMIFRAWSRTYAATATSESSAIAF